MALKRRKDLIAVHVLLRREQYNNIPSRYRDRYIRRLIDQDMALDKEESFLQFMGKVGRSL